MFKTNITNLAKEKLEQYAVDCQQESNHQSTSFKEILRKEQELHLQEMEQLKASFKTEIETFENTTVKTFKTDLDNLRRDFKVKTLNEVHDTCVKLSPSPTPSTKSFGKPPYSAPSNKHPFTTSTP